jgi:hypothetical protein
LQLGCLQTFDSLISRCRLANEDFAACPETGSTWPNLKSEQPDFSRAVTGNRQHRFYGRFFNVC